MAKISPGGWTIIDLTIVLIILDILATILRFVARRSSKVDYGADDVWIVVALVAFISNVVADYWSWPMMPQASPIMSNISKGLFDGGVGWPMETLTPEQLIVYYKVYSPLNDNNSLQY